MRNEEDGLLRVKRGIQTRQNGHEMQNGGHIQMLTERNQNVVDLLGAVFRLSRRPNAVDMVFGNPTLDG